MTLIRLSAAWLCCLCGVAVVYITSTAVGPPQLLPTATCKHINENEDNIVLFVLICTY